MYGIDLLINNDLIVRLLEVNDNLRFESNNKISTEIIFTKMIDEAFLFNIDKKFN